MLTKEENERLTQVGPGTPMGQLLRHYWHPIAATAELEEHPTKPIRLLGEDLVLYRDLGGNYGLLQRGCAHRLSDLAMGIVEEYGLRCYAHGWLYSDSGQCIDQPLEPEPFCDEIKIRAYKVETKGGMVWAYMGPEPAPLVPSWEPFTWDDGLVQIVFARIPCNWLQCQENSLDPVDLEWVHSMKDMDAPPPLPQRDLEIAFDEFEHGFVYRRAPKTEGQAQADWSVGRTAIWPNAVFVGDQRSCRIEWRVPSDDESTLNVIWFVDRPAAGRKLRSKRRVFHWYAPVKDEDSGEFLTSHPINRTFNIWVNQGKIFDRTKEHLVETDAGVVMLRTKYSSQIDLVHDGGEPKATIRDASKNRAIALPHTTPALGAIPAAAADATAAAEFPYIAGQPEEVAKVYREVAATWRAPMPRTRRERPQPPGS